MRLTWLLAALIGLGLAAHASAALPPIDPPPPPIDPQPEPPEPVCLPDPCAPPCHHQPEPASLSLLAIGAGICGYRAWRRQPVK